MSTIERIEVERLSLPLHTPFVTALRRATSVETVVVRVTDSDGRVGVGEAPQAWQVTGDSVPARDLLGLAHVRRPVETPIMADESVFDLEGLGVSVGCMLESPVGVRGGVALAARAGCDVAPDLDGAWWLVAGAPYGDRVAYQAGQVRMDA